MASCITRESVTLKLNSSLCFIMTNVGLDSFHYRAHLWINNQPLVHCVMQVLQYLLSEILLFMSSLLYCCPACFGENVINLSEDRQKRVCRPAG